MSVLVEFIGGPLDGERRVMPDARPRWYLHQPPSPSFIVSTTGPDMPVLRHLIYERTSWVVEISADGANRHLLYELQP